MRHNEHLRISGSIKWIVLALGLLLLLFFIYGIILYIDTQESKTAGFQKTEQKVLKETEIAEISSVSRFQEKSAYHIVFGKTKERQTKIAFVSLDGNNRDILVIDSEKIIPKQNVEESWMSQCQSCELVKISPAIIDSEPLWEIAYKNDAESYILDYVSMYNGSKYEQFRLKSMFN